MLNVFKKKKNNNKILFLILDGVGINKDYPGNAVTQANTPCFNKLLKEYPNITLGASEEFVGLPKGQMGSSEVGHFTFGAGKVVDSEIVRIDKAINNGEFYRNQILNDELSKIKGFQALHIAGLLSDGGIHSSINHLFTLLEVVSRYNNISQVYLHIFTDGRDTSPNSSKEYISKLQERIKLTPKVQIASICGRYYGMDRDNRWDRQKKLYNLIVNGIGERENDIVKYIDNSYSQGVTDEFLIPTLFNENGLIKDKDTMIFFNFRSDRAREFTRMFVDKSFDSFLTKKMSVNFITFTEYDSKFKNIKVLFPPLKQQPGLGQIISKLGYNQLRIAETEKYAHVTYFFNLGDEHPNKREDRILVPSPGVSTYDLKPEMSAKIITSRLLETLNKDYKLTVVNFANGDMVGHTGNISAAIKAMETVDQCLEIIFKKVDLDNTTVIVTADHGNCDEMLLPDGKTSTSHSLNKVPFIVVSKKEHKLRTDKELSIANVAPTILKLLDEKVPEYMAEDLLDY
ncbi:MAG TPA: 2,3-bisphosphoglycerate-independent phosphoglycerate mutase [archaeon]|nr:2,3-bisphosphoglycerate-independent phosphoglycerate mutase [archaeon]